MWLMWERSTGPVWLNRTEGGREGSVNSLPQTHQHQQLSMEETQAKWRSLAPSSGNIGNGLVHTARALRSQSRGIDSVPFGVSAFWRRLAEVDSERQIEEGKGFQRLWIECLHQMGRSEDFISCWSAGIFTLRHLLALQKMAQKRENTRRVAVVRRRMATWCDESEQDDWQASVRDRKATGATRMNGNENITSVVVFTSYHPVIKQLHSCNQSDSSPLSCFTSFH